MMSTPGASDARPERLEQEMSGCKCLWCDVAKAMSVVDR